MYQSPQTTKISNLHLRTATDRSGTYLRLSVTVGGGICRFEEFSGGVGVGWCKHVLFLLLQTLENPFVSCTADLISIIINIEHAQYYGNEVCKFFS